MAAAIVVIAFFGGNRRLHLFKSGCRIWAASTVVVLVWAVGIYSFMPQHKDLLTGAVCGSLFGLPITDDTKLSGLTRLSILVGLGVLFGVIQMLLTS